MAEFDTFDSFLDWFENQKPEWQPVLAARIALRALPVAFVDKMIASSVTDEEEIILLQLFRAVLLLDENANTPSTINLSLAADANKFLTSVLSNPAPLGTSMLAILLINCLKFVDEIIERKKNINIEPEKFFRDNQLTSSQNEIFSHTALAEDLAFLNDALSSEINMLNNVPLFSSSDSEVQLVYWPHLQSAMLSVHNGWDVWAEYYAHRLEGRSFDRWLFEAVASIDKSYWKRKPAVLNAKIHSQFDAYNSGFGEEDQEEFESENSSGITDKESFAKWLEEKPAEWAQVLTARCAIRVLPLVGKVLEAKSFDPEAQQDLIIPSFRATSISWAARGYPTHDIIDAAAAAASAADAAFSATFAAADAAAHATSAASDAATIATADIVYAGHAVTFAVAYDAAFVAADAADDIWNAINQDVRFLESHKGESVASAKALAKQALWVNDEGVVATPDWLLFEFKNLSRTLSELYGNWHVWTVWYQSRLDGTESWGLKPANAETLMLRIAKQGNDWWEQGATNVNGKIAKWLSDLRAEEWENEFLPDELPEIPPQSAAPVETEIVENQVRRRQIPTDVNLSGVAPSHSILRSESEFLAGRLGGQLPDTGSVLDKCHAALGNTLEDIQIYEVGYWNAALQQMAARIDESMLDDAAGRFAGFLINLKTFVEQHEEWMAYSANPDRQRIAEATDLAALENLGAIAENISEFSVIIDTPVVIAIADMKQAMSEVQQYNGETLYGFVYSVANVLQSLAKLAIDNVPKEVRNSTGKFANDVSSAVRKAAVTGSAGLVVTLIERITVNMLGLSQSYPTVFGWVKPLLAYLGLK